MKTLITTSFIIYIAVMCALTHSQTSSPLTEDYTSINQPSDAWKQVLGPTGNAGEHVGQLCFNQTGNYIDNQYYSFESDTVDLSLWAEVELTFFVAQNIRNGDRLYVYYLDGADMLWYGWDVSGIQGQYILNVPTTAILFSVDLDTDANGNVNGKYAHMDYFYLKDPGAGVLPIELISFVAHEHEGCNHIEWTTASEANTDYYNLEWSVDAYEWTSIETLPAAGNSNMILNYKTIDKTILPTINYYRLIQYDYDGVYEIFGPIAVDNRKREKRIVKYVSLSGKEIDPTSTTGLVIGIFEDGTTVKVYL